MRSMSGNTSWMAARASGMVMSSLYSFLYTSYLGEALRLFVGDLEVDHAGKTNHLQSFVHGGERCVWRTSSSLRTTELFFVMGQQHVF